MTIYLPYRLTSLEVFKYFRGLPLDTTETIYFDFQNCRFLDPMAMLVLSSEIVNLKRTYNVIVTNYFRLTYPAHMGFFRAMGIDFGKSPRREEFINNYIPIRIVNAEGIRKHANENGLHYGEYIENYFVPDFLNILTEKLTSNIVEILKYCIREIIRNIIEHSQCEQFAICGQYYPARRQISLAIVDTGIGLRKSLKNNPKLRISNDLEAIDLALSQGISGKVFSGMKNRPKGTWANSGYGLFMTSSICQIEGDFTIVSGGAGCHYEKDIKNFFASSYHGTAVNLTISLNLNQNLPILLNTISGNLSRVAKPSTASMDIIR